MGRFAAPDEMAQAVGFLANPARSGFVNGRRELDVAADAQALRKPMIPCRTGSLTYGSPENRKKR